MTDVELLSLEEFARMTARIELDSTESVLSDAMLTTERWIMVQRHWLTRMANQAARGKPGLHRRFLELVDASRTIAKADHDANKLRAGSFPVAPSMRRVVAIQRNRSAADGIKGATGTQAGGHATAATSPAVRRKKHKTSPVRAMPQRSSDMPFVEGTTGHASPRPGRNKELANLEFSGDTLDEAEAPPSYTLPFRRGRRKQAVYASHSPTTGFETNTDPQHPQPSPGETADLLPEASPFAMPFQPPERSKEGVSHRSSASQVRRQAEDDANAAPEIQTDPLAKTALLGPRERAIAVARAGGMSQLEQEFSASRPSDTAPPDTAPADTAPPDTAPPDTAPADEDPFVSTRSLSPDALAKARSGLPFSPPQKTEATASPEKSDQPQPGHVLPFRPQARSDSDPSNDLADLPLLSLDQYAWLCRRLREAEGNEEEILAWMGIAPDVKSKLDAHWKKRFEEDADAKARFDVALEKY